ncbi:MAG: hypothetical protein COT90_04610 [Candidatus Diapherotrites archaeon CG10_big_fil_rev_8_21_14_0_10_31_34]|nr:MAG: hypothetical protein COT90_04610 [Candidatus Diapherotrites archaeon CG10_big_fil_rev_8_21_14_0_10_31_34]
MTEKKTEQKKEIEKMINLIEEKAPFSKKTVPKTQEKTELKQIIPEKKQTIPEKEVQPQNKKTNIKQIIPVKKEVKAKKEKQPLNLLEKESSKQTFEKSLQLKPKGLSAQQNQILFVNKKFLPAFSEKAEAEQKTEKKKAVKEKTLEQELQESSFQKTKGISQQRGDEIEKAIGLLEKEDDRLKKDALTEKVNKLVEDTERELGKIQFTGKEITPKKPEKKGLFSFLKKPKKD